MVDPFWHKLQEAYIQVKVKPEQAVEFELNGLKAYVQFKPGGTDGHVRWKSGVVVSIEEVPIEPPVLISPGHDERE